MDSAGTSYLTTVRQLFAYYRSLGEKALDQVAEDQINWQYHPDSNSISVIVKHLWGNMLSRWTDFLTSDGEKPWREREAEFDNDVTSKSALLEKWAEGWNCLFTALDALEDRDLPKVVYIRKEAHTVLEAINRQLAHYAYHVGQLVYLARMLKGSDWQSLSIPRGGSADFNREKMH